MSARFLGRGWRFPVGVGPHGGFALSEGPEDIQEAVWIILGTAPGERPMLPAFGCGIHDLVFAPDDPARRGDVAHAVRAALARWEPRIDVLDVRVGGDPEPLAPLLIDIDYRIRATNAFDNLVYPYFAREGSAA
jgi:phage baseplate assembly protein W